MMEIELFRVGVAAYCVAAGVPRHKIVDVYTLIQHEKIPKNMADTIIQLDSAIEKVMGET